MNEHISIDRWRRGWVASLRLAAWSVVFLLILGTLTVSNDALRRNLYATDDSVAQPNARPVRPKIRQVPEAERFFGMLLQDAYCFQYDGAMIEFWIEVEVDGKTIRFGEELSRDVFRYRRDAEKLGRTFAKPSGPLLWVIRREKGMEIWDIAVSIKDDKGNGFRTKSVGILPPQVKAVHTTTRRDRSSSRNSSEILLVDIESRGERTDKIIRSAKFKCKFVD
jgi:hypothetical protein